MPAMGSYRALPRAFYRRSVERVAADLLGRWLVSDLDGSRTVLRIVETEAYLGAADRASHGWNGRRTRRNASLYFSGGHAYVFWVYGLHLCLNAVTGDPGVASAVLIRAGEPRDGEATMVSRRGLSGAARPGAVAGGPGKLAQALGVTRELDGARLYRGELRVAGGCPTPESEIVRSPRVGIDYAGEAVRWPLRFSIRGNRHVSSPRPG